MAPVILKTEVHCLGCARKIRKAIKNLPGVENVWATPDTGLVVVAGRADPSALQSRIQQKIRRPVTIVSNGAENPTTPRGMLNVGPRHHAMQPPALAANRYERRHVPATGRYVPRSEPVVCFKNESPKGCCVQ